MGVASEGTLITARTREILEIPARSKSPDRSRAVTSKSTVAPWESGRKATT